MSEKNIMIGVSNMIDFIKTKTVGNIIEANNRKMIEVDSTTLRKIANLIESSIQSAFIDSSKEITSRLK